MFFMLGASGDSASFYWNVSSQCNSSWLYRFVCPQSLTLFEMTVYIVSCVHNHWCFLKWLFLNSQLEKKKKTMPLTSSNSSELHSHDFKSKMFFCDRPTGWKKEIEQRPRTALVDCCRPDGNLCFLPLEKNQFLRACRLSLDTLSASFQREDLVTQQFFFFFFFCNFY